MPFSLKSLQGMSARDYINILNDDAAKITYSQMGEDVVIHYLLTRKAGKMDAGFYVDVGAHHPRQFSNTKFLNIVGWRGINIDASPASIACFDLERPRDINVCCGVGPTDATMTFYQFANSAASTLSFEQAEIWQKELGWKMVGTTIVNVRPLNSILDEFLPSAQEIDYMNVDLEGFDSEVIRSLDFSRFRPKVLTIELHDVNNLALGQDQAISYIVDNAYRLMSMNLMTFSFVDCRLPVLGA